MSKPLTLKIQRRTQPEICIWIVLIMPFLFGTIFDLLHLPSILKYTLDIAWLFLLMLMFLNLKSQSDKVAKNKVLFIWCLAFFVFTLVGYIFNFQSVFYYLWGIRNNFRYYVFFLACILFFKIGDVPIFFKLLDVLFWINVVVCFVQYFILHIRGDWLGGIFGTTIGCTGYTNMFFVIVSLKSIIFCLNKKESILSCILKFGAMFVIAAFAEIKFFYVIFVLIIAMAFLMTDFSWRKLVIVALGLLGLMVGATLLAVVFPGSAGFLSIDSIYNYAASEGGYTASGDINRLTAIPIISKSFLTNGFKDFFGLGLGNCDTATFSLFQTPFYAQYSHINYNWFSVAFMFLYGQMASILSVCCILIAFYNSTLRFEAGYMAYFVLALPFIGINGNKSQIEQ